MSYVKTAMLLALLTAIFVAIGGLAGGQTGMVIAFIVALGMNAFSLWKSDKMVLSMHEAEEVNEQTAPEYYGLVRDLAARAELPMPRVYVLHSAQPNAFATGRNPANSAVAASAGLLESLSREEVAGVMAHELAHIKNRDTLIMTVAATIGGAISMLAQYLQFHTMFGGNRNNGGGAMSMITSIAAMLLAPMAAMLVQMAISRSREYEADRVGAEIVGDPNALADALESLEAGVHRIHSQWAENNPAAAHLCIVNPLAGVGTDNLFSTHPKTANRVAALRAMAPSARAAAPRGFTAPVREAEAPRRNPWAR